MALFIHLLFFCGFVALGQSWDQHREVNSCYVRHSGTSNIDLQLNLLRDNILLIKTNLENRIRDSECGRDYGDDIRENCMQLREYIDSVYQQVQSVNETLQEIARTQLEHAVDIDNLYDRIPSTSSTWTSVPLTIIGRPEIDTPDGNFSLAIPETLVPNTATEVFVHVSVQSGSVPSMQSSHQIKIFTMEGSVRFEQYLALFYYNQNAWNTNSDNMWFPLTTDRSIHIENPHACDNNSCHMVVAVIGYR